MCLLPLLGPLQFAFVHLITERIMADYVMYCTGIYVFDIFVWCPVT